MKNIENKIQMKPIILLVAVILVLAISGQVYASVNGYDNLFFLIKDMKIAKANTKEEIFEDSEILLSYKYIDVTNDIKMQVNKIEIVNGKSIFYVNIKNKSKDNKILPFHYIVRVERKYEDGYIPVFRPEAGGEIYVGKKDNTNFYQDTIEIPCEIGEDDIIFLDVLDKDDNCIRNFQINISFKIFIFTFLSFPILLITIIGFNNESPIYTFRYIIKFLFKQKVYMFKKQF